MVRGMNERKAKALKERQFDLKCYDRDYSEKVKEKFRKRFSDQILGKVCEGKVSEENRIEIKWGCSEQFWFDALEKMLDGRRFWVRVWPEVTAVFSGLGFDPISSRKTGNMVDTWEYITYMQIYLEEKSDLIEEDEEEGVK